MGIDIVGYANATKSADQTEDSGGVRVWINDSFPGRANEFESGVFYDVGDEGPEAHVSMGYIGYGGFRDRLAQLAGYPKGNVVGYGPSHCAACWGGEAGPFSELINFSDCEGTIGTAVSKKLAEDFAKFQEAADAVSEQVFFNERYAKLRLIFETAAQGGFVKFS